MEYRKEIDGLRAIAVVPVVLYHAHFEFFKGGFIGVDIFFVISGYLITSLLLKEYSVKQSISIKDFYARRIRRIIPALVLVILFSSVASFMWLTPSQLENYGKSVISTFSFLSNVYFFKSTNYFDSAAELNPLLHTWSLSVEEQFYIFFPALLFILLAFRSALLMPVIVVSFLASLALSVYFVYENPQMVFYLIFFRVWELLAGALCAYLLFTDSAFVQKVGKSLANVLSGLGLLLVLLAITQLDSGLLLPIWWAFSAVVGASLIILYSKTSVIGTLLSFRAFVWIGLISYSLYLWHQPIFAFARIRTMSEPSTLVFLGLIGLCLVISFLSLRFVETPFRRKNVIPAAGVYTVCGFGVSLLLSYGVFCYFSGGATFRYDEAVLSAIEPESDRVINVCPNKVALASVEGVQLCEFGDLTKAHVELVLVGDSHANMFVGKLDEALTERGKKGAYVTNWNCHVIPGLVQTELHRRNMEACLNSHSKVLEFIANNNASVVASARWSFRLAPIDGYLRHSFFDNEAGGVERIQHVELRPNYALVNGLSSNRADDIETIVRSYLRGLKAHAKSLMVINPVPEVGWDVPDYNFNSYLNTGTIPSDITTDYGLYKKRHRFFLDRVAATLEDEGVYVVSPDEFLCDTKRKRCYAQRDGVSFYFDDDHLNSHGTAPLVDTIVSRLIPFPQKTFGYVK